MRSKKQTRPGFAYDALDSVIHERARLSVLTSLVTHPKGLAFADLKSMCALTDGNLNRHLAVLEEVGLIATKKSTQPGRPQTLVSLTASGLRRFQQYLSVLEQVVADAAENQRRAAAQRPAKSVAGWSPA